MTVVSRGANPPDMDAIRDSVSNPSSQYYYQPLMERYSVNDSTLTFDDYHYLYYGFVEQLDYMPLLENSARLELESIMSGQITPTEDDYRRAISLATALLKIEPFNPRDLNALAYLYAMVGQEEYAAQLMHKLDMVVSVIKATGDGLSDESPWWVTYFAHAEDIVALAGLDQGKPIILSTSIEFIPIAKMADRKKKGYYFNYSLIYTREPDYLENVEKPKRKFDWTPWESDNKFRY